MASLSKQSFGLPFYNTSAGAGYTFNAHTLDANNDAWAAIFQAEDTNAITHIGFRYGVRTGTPPTYVATLEGASATTGDPDGVDVGGASPTAKTFTPPADATWDGTWQWIQLTNAFTPTRGQFLALTIRYSSGTVDGSNNSTFTTDVSNATTAAVHFPYADRLTAGTWAQRATPCVYGIRTASTRYGHIVQSHFNTATAATAGHRQALKFTLPAGSGDTFKIVGFRAMCAFATASRAPIAGLWDASGVIQNVTLDTELIRVVTTAAEPLLVIFDEATLTALDFGTAYYIGFEVPNPATTVRINGAQLASADDIVAWPGGSDFLLAGFDGSVWTPDATVRPFVQLLIDDWTEPASGAAGTLIGPGRLLRN